MADTGYVVKTETTCSPGEPRYLRIECPECKALREALDGQQETIERLEQRLATSDTSGSIMEMMVEHAELRKRLAQVSDTAGGPITYARVLECLAMLRPLEAVGEPNTLVALVGKAMVEIADLRARLEASEQRCGQALEVLSELVEVAGLRGDSSLPHPADDLVLWTARMQTAWDEAAALLATDAAQSCTNHGKHSGAGRYWFCERCAEGKFPNGCGDYKPTAAAQGVER